MELRSCKVNGVYFCIWFDSERFNIEDMEANKVLPLFETQLRWVVDQIGELLNGLSERFFLRNIRNDSRVIRILKFRANSGWTRCVVWPASRGRIFIHVSKGTTQKGWISFLKMIEGFLYSFEADHGQHDKIQNSKMVPKINYADAVKNYIITKAPTAPSTWKKDLLKSFVSPYEI